MLYLPKERGESREVLEQLSDIPMTLSVDKGMGSGRTTNPHPWGTPHTGSSHPQVTSKPFPTSVKPPLLRTVRPSSLCHSHLKQDPGTLQCSCPPSVQLHTRALFHCFSLPGILLHPKLFASPVPGQHSKLSPDITFSREPSSTWQLGKMPLLYSQKSLCLPQLPEFNVTTQPVPPPGHALSEGTPTPVDLAMV